MVNIRRTQLDREITRHEHPIIMSLFSSLNLKAFKVILFYFTLQSHFNIFVAFRRMTLYDLRKSSDSSNLWLLIDWKALYLGEDQFLTHRLSVYDCIWGFELWPMGKWGTVWEQWESPPTLKPHNSKKERQTFLPVPGYTIMAVQTSTERRDSLDLRRNVCFCQHFSRRPSCQSLQHPTFSMLKSKGEFGRFGFWGYANALQLLGTTK